MKKETGIAAASGGLAIGAIAITSDQAKGWLDIASIIAESPASLMLFILLILVLMGWMLVRQWQGGQECEARIDKLLDALRTIHTMLAMDERFSDQLPGWNDFIGGQLDVRTLNRRPKP